MSDYSLDIKSEKSSRFKRFQEKLYEKAVLGKFLNGYGVIYYLFFAVCIALIGGFGGVEPLLLVLGIILGLPVLAAVTFNLKFGIAVFFVLTFTILGLGRLIPDVPFGLSFDIVTLALVFGLIIRQAAEKDLSFLRNAVSLMILVWIIYNFLLFFNPEAPSQLAWLYTIRAMAALFVLYYVLLYALDSVRFIYLLISIWLSIAFIGALYGIFQDTIGFRQFEWQWLATDMVRFSRYHQFGNYRVWSFFSGAMVFGILMAHSAVACLLLTEFTKSWLFRIALVVAAAVMLYAMMLSGTRAAYIVPVVALVVYVIMRAEWKFILFCSAGLIAFTYFLYIPTQNERIQQFQSAFKPGDDASFEVRIENQQFIQPFIQSHPIGGGLGSTGIWGQRFAPDSFLARFPPDSGFVRIAVESGWIGLLLYCLLLLVILHTGIRNYFSMHDENLKLLQLFFLTILICLIVTNYPQESIHSPPMTSLFFLSAAALTGLIKLDTEPTPDLQPKEKTNEDQTAETKRYKRFNS